MKTISRVRLAALAAILSAQAQGAHAQSAAQSQWAGAQTPVACTLTVTGQNNSDVDVSAVTNAVTSGALSGAVTVCLTGTFDFGAGPPPAGSVLIAPAPAVTSLRIVGLTDRGRRATIRNGAQPLTSPAPPTVARLSIENLRFENPAFTAILIAQVVDSLNISGVQIAGVQSLFFPQFNSSFHSGIIVSSLLAPIHGEITIADNVIDGGTYGPSDATGVNAGISLAGAVAGLSQQVFDAHSRVTDNRLVNWSAGGILATGIGDAVIERNKIDPGAFANTASSCFGAQSGITLAGVSDSVVRDNEINLVRSLTANGDPPVCTAGIIVRGTLLGAADGNILYRNSVRGTGSYALAVGVSSAAAETDNFFALNPTWGFTPQKAMLFLGPAATGNAFIGYFPSVEGNVDGNSIIHP